MFEPRTGPLYALMALTALVAWWLMASLGFTVTLSAWAILALPAYVVVAGILARRIGWTMTGSMLEGGALFYQQGLVVMFLLFGLAAQSGPFADDLLSSWDRSIGFDWMAYFEFSRQYSAPLLFAYRSFNWQPAVVVIALVLTAREDRLWTVITASFLACLLCAAVFAFVPAQAPFHHYGITFAEFPERRTQMGWTFLNVLNDIRAGEREISPSLFTGMISFPSYHSAAAVMFAWALWPTKLRWPAVVLNTGLLASTPTMGNHYLVDVIAGIAVGALAIISASLVTYLRSRQCRGLGRDDQNNLIITGGRCAVAKGGCDRAV
jgi:membrane-associated phospholipid phosphatase